MSLYISIATATDRETSKQHIIAGPVTSAVLGGGSAEIVHKYSNFIADADNRAKYSEAILLLNNRRARGHKFPDLIAREEKAAEDEYRRAAIQKLSLADRLVDDLTARLETARVEQTRARNTAAIQAEPVPKKKASKKKSAAKKPE